MERELLGNYTRMCLPILNPDVRGEDHGLHDLGEVNAHLFLVLADVPRNLTVSEAIPCGKV